MTRGLSDSATRAGAFRRNALPAILLMIAAGFLTRPMGPWWLSADCDATYAASALNLMMGQGTEKLDHPGLPLQALLTISLKLHHAVTSIWTGESTSQYVAATFADMSRVLWILRAWALAFLLGMVSTVFIVCRRLARRAGRNEVEATLAGIAGVVLLLACPGTLTHATGFRPENPLAILCLLAVWGLIEALHDQSAWRVPVCAALVGLAITVKIHALALVPVVAVAAWTSTRWRHRAGRAAGMGLDAHEADDLAVAVGEWLWPIALGGAGWLSATVWLNMGRDWRAIDPRILLGVGALATWTVIAALIARARRASFPPRQTSLPPIHDPRFPIHDPRSPIHDSRFARLCSPVVPGVMLAGLLGMLVPNACFLDELTPMLRAMWYTMRGAGGHGSTAMASLAAATWAQWTSPSLLPVWALGIAAGLGSIQAVRRGRSMLLHFAAAAFAACALAAVRGAAHFSPHHYGLAMVLSIPLMLEALGFLGAPRTPARIASHQAWRMALTLVVCAWPMIACERSARGQATRCAALENLTELCSASLDDREVILCDYWAQNADAAHFMQAREMSRYKPDLSYRSLPDTPTGLRYADQHGLRPAFYLTSGPARTRVSRNADGTWTARGAWGLRWRVLPIATRDVGGLTLGAYLILERLDEENDATSASVSSETAPPSSVDPAAPEQRRGASNVVRVAGVSASRDGALTALCVGPTVAARRGSLWP